MRVSLVSCIFSLISLILACTDLHRTGQPAAATTPPLPRSDATADPHPNAATTPASNATSAPTPYSAAAAPASNAAAAGEPTPTSAAAAPASNAAAAGETTPISAAAASEFAGAAAGDEEDFPDALMGTAPDNAVPNPYAEGFAGPVCGELQMLLAQMGEEEKEAKISHLKALNAEDFHRENNAARNRFLLDNIGLAEASKETLWGGADAAVAGPKRAVAKRKATKGKSRRGKKGTKRARKGKDVESDEVSDSGSDRSDEDDSSAGEGGEGEGESTAPPRAPRAPRTVTAKAKANPKKWAISAQSFLANGDLGEQWVKLLGLWWDRESAAGFEGGVRIHILFSTTVFADFLADKIVFGKETSQAGRRMDPARAHQYPRHRGH